MRFVTKLIPISNIDINYLKQEFGLKQLYKSFIITCTTYIYTLRDA